MFGEDPIEKEMGAQEASSESMAHEEPTVADEVSTIIEEGSFEKDLLVDFDSHVSSDIWLGKKRKKLRTICHTNNMFEWEIAPPMERILESWGFDLFSQRTAILHTYRALVTALVERWRWETNSFHLRTGESTVTLEDVSMILKLPVYGLPITCVEALNWKTYWRDNWFEELSNAEVEAGYGKSGIKLRWVRERYSNLHVREADRTPAVYRLHCKAYVFYLMGAILFPSKNSDVIHARYLSFLLDDSRIADYAWGPAVLCYLYRALGDATRKTSNTIAAYLPLLEVWCYDRIPVKRHIPNVFLEHQLPRAAAWAYECHEMPGNRNRREKGPSHVTLFYRGELDVLEDELIRWQPYKRWDEDVEEEIEDWRFMARLAGSCRVPLIHFGTVEYQMPDRVVRQFSDVRHIPQPPVDMNDIRGSIGRKRKAGKLVGWREQINREWQSFADGELGDQVVVNDGGEDGDIEKRLSLCSYDEYMEWFRRKSKMRIQPPSKGITQDYIPRGMYDNTKALGMMDSCMKIFERLEESGMPEVMYEVLPDFLKEFGQFMMEVRDPSYKRPKFARIDYEREEERGHKESAEPGEPTAAADVGGDLNTEPVGDRKMIPVAPNVLDLAQSHPTAIGEGCSQDVREDVFRVDVKIEPVAEQCSSPVMQDLKLGKKLVVSRALRSSKGMLKKKLRDENRQWLDVNWFASRKRNIKEDPELFPLEHPAGLYTLHRTNILGLARRQEVETTALDAYSLLLADRELIMRLMGHRLKSSFYFIPSYFMTLAHQYVRGVVPENKKMAFYAGYVSRKPHKPISPPVNEKSYIFFPACLRKHWIMFVFCVAEWSVIVLDPLVDDKDGKTYQKEYPECFIATESVIPDMLRATHPDRFPHPPVIFTNAIRPKQKNFKDCGIMVMKYMDFMCHGVQLYTEEWTELEVLNFRYRIVHEIMKCRACPLSNMYLDLRMS